MVSPDSDAMAVILAGGLGTRLRSVVSDRPKPMADVGGKPFIEYLVQRLLLCNFRNILICISYKRESIIDYFNSQHRKNIRFSIEEQPLGTAGALKNATAMLTDSFVVLNGDTFVEANYRKMLSFHIANRADATIALVKGNSADAGHVALEGERVVGFMEKGQRPTGFMSAGLYVMQKIMLEKIPTNQSYSLETGLFPSIIKDSNVLGYVVEGAFIDIGSPEKYLQVRKNYGLLRK